MWALYVIAYLYSGPWLSERPMVSLDECEKEAVWLAREWAMTDYAVTVGCRNKATNESLVVLFR